MACGVNLDSWKTGSCEVDGSRGASIDLKQVKFSLWGPHQSPNCALDLLNKAQVMFNPSGHQFIVARDENICKIEFLLLISVSSSEHLLNLTNFVFPFISHFRSDVCRPNKLFSDQPETKQQVCNTFFVSLERITSFFNLLLNRCKQKANDSRL